jgi:hypothetical protein
MKHSALLLVIASIILFTNKYAKSEDIEPSEAQCSKILEACRAAGYGKTNQDNKKKSIYRDCFSQILKGIMLTDVKVATEDINTCKAKKAELKK